MPDQRWDFWLGRMVRLIVRSCWNYILDTSHGPLFSVRFKLQVWFGIHCAFIKLRTWYSSIDHLIASSFLCFVFSYPSLTICVCFRFVRASAMSVTWHRMNQIFVVGKAHAFFWFLYHTFVQYDTQRLSLPSILKIQCHRSRGSSQLTHDGVWHFFPPLTDEEITYA